MAASNPLEQIKAFFTRFTLQQKLAIAGSGSLVLVLLWVLVHFMIQVEYQTLYSELDPQEAQAIVQKLTELKVPYELATDGRTIKIASDKLAEVRIQLASQGLPESGRIGFEIFDRTNFGLTNFQEQVNYQRALEGELARSIMTLAEVEAARVHLVLAKESLFQSSDDQTKASVILKLKNGRSLTPSAAQGIVNVVASSVKGLTPEKVVLIDYRGKILSHNEGSDSGLSVQQLDARQKLETELSNKIVQILEPAVGQGKVRPQVSALMNFQQVEETVEQYDPQGSVVRGQSKQEEHQPRNERIAVGGIPGPRGSPAPNPANPAAITPGSPAPSPDTQSVATGAADNLLKRNETINYEVSKAVRHVVNPVGKVDRISVAVLIDNHTKLTTGSDGKPQPTQEPRNADDMKKYKDLISAAIGFNPDRGDQLTVENISFEGESEFIEKPTFLEKQAPVIMIGLRYLIIPVVFILLYLFFLRPVQKSLFGNLAPAGALAGPRNLPRLPGTVQTPMTVKQLEAQLNGVKDDYANTPEREFLPLPTPSKMDLIRKRVVEHAQSDPETVARLVRMWLADERNK